MFDTNVFGIAPDHTRQHAFCSVCNENWGTCVHARSTNPNVFPIDRRNRRLVLESQIHQQHGGYYGANRQPMYCGYPSCNAAWGTCSHVGYGPVCNQGNSLGFELEMIGALDGDPTLVEEGAILNMTGGGYSNSGMGGLTGLVETELLLDAAEDRDYNQGGYGGGNTYVENTYVDNNTYVDQGNGGGGNWDNQYDDGQGNSGGGDWDDQNNWQ